MQLITPKKRIEYIDIAKGIGMILVVIGHCINDKTFPGTWIYSFHMPLFFVLSGLCFSDKKYPTFLPFLWKKVRTLLLPCFYFSLLITILSTLTYGGFTFTNLIFEGFPGALWFVFILFLAEIAYYFIQKNSKTNIYLIIYLIISLFFSLIIGKNFNLPYCICSTFIAIFYYGLGHLSKMIFSPATIAKTNKILLSFLLLCIPGIIVLTTNHTLNLRKNYIPTPEILYVLLSLLETLGLLIISTFKFKRYIRNIILYIGNNTLIILSLHIFFIQFSAQYIKPLLSNFIIYKIFEQIFIWLLIYISIEIINKKLEWLLGK